MTTTPSRRLSTLSLVLAPTLLGAALLTDLSPQAHDTRELLDLIRERPGAWSTAQALFLLSALAWLPAGLALSRLFARGARLARFAAAAVAIGGLAMLPIDAAGLYVRDLATSDIPQAQQMSLVERVESSPILLALETVHAAGLILGLSVVGVAMLRRRDLPRWAGALVLVGVVGIVTAPGGPLLAVAAALLVGGLGVAALHVDRGTDAELRDAGRPSVTTNGEPASSTPRSGDGTSRADSAPRA